MLRYHFYENGVCECGFTREQNAAGKIVSRDLKGEISTEPRSCTRGFVNKAAVPKVETEDEPFDEVKVMAIVLYEEFIRIDLIDPRKITDKAEVKSLFTKLYNEFINGQKFERSSVRYNMATMARTVYDINIKQASQ